MTKKNKNENCWNKFTEQKTSSNFIKTKMKEEKDENS